MKKVITIFITVLTITSSFSQSPIIEVCSGVSEDEVLPQTYFKDINNTFDKFIGTWKFEDGTEILIFKISKVTQYYNQESQIFEDYLIGNYSYSTDNGNTFVVNTITTTIDENPDNNPMYSSCAEGNKISFIFEDILLNKDFCWAYFEFLPNSLTQMNVSIKNPDGTVGILPGNEPFNPNFSIPTSVIVTKIN